MDVLIEPEIRYCKRPKKKKKLFVIEFRFKGLSFRGGEWMYEWRRWKAYPTEKQRDIALEGITKSGREICEYRKALFQ